LMASELCSLTHRKSLDGLRAVKPLDLLAQMGHACLRCRYSDAAKLRDMLGELEVQSKRAAALAEEFGSGPPNLQFRLGQRVVHRNHGYRWGVR
jgi:hypothetical protein